jgi:iron-sulfur cluster insertion protein
MNISVTPRASEELRKAVEQYRQQEENLPEAVRVYVAHQCGCGSAHFGMGFDDPEAGDTKIDINGVTLLVDEMAAPLLEDAEVDYSDDLMQQGFLIHTANVAGGCGCGGHGHGHGHEGHHHHA